MSDQAQDGVLPVRIDKGIRRGKRIKPHMLETKARNEAGQFLSAYTPELKQKAIEQGLIALECGARIEEVADNLKIPRATMYSWLIGHEAGKARTLFFDGQCAMHLADMADPETTPGPIDLTRKRELLAGWIKVAERRDPKSWAQKQEVTLDIGADLAQALADARDRVAAQLPQRTIEHNQVDDVQVVESKPD